MAIKLHPGIAVHPGPCLRTEIAEPAVLSVTALAERLRVAPRPQVTSSMAMPASLRKMAIRSETAFGIKADTLMRMQAAYELT